MNFAKNSFTRYKLKLEMSAIKFGWKRGREYCVLAWNTSTRPFDRFRTAFNTQNAIFSRFLIRHYGNAIFIESVRQHLHYRIFSEFLDNFSKRSVFLFDVFPHFPIIFENYLTHFLVEFDKQKSLFRRFQHPKVIFGFVSSEIPTVFLESPMKYDNFYDF